MNDLQRKMFFWLCVGIIIDWAKNLAAFGCYGAVCLIVYTICVNLPLQLTAALCVVSNLFVWPRLMDRILQRQEERIFALKRCLEAIR